MAEHIPKRRLRPLLWLGGALAALAFVAVVVARLRRQRTIRRPPSLPDVPSGLTEAEAAARWSEGQDNTVHLKPPRTRQQIWRENLYTVFNLSLVGLAFTQALLGQWLSALLSFGTIFLNVGLNVAQEMLAMRRLAEFQRAARPKATVVREGKTRSLDPNQIVADDILIAGPGDQFLADGEVVGSGQMVVDSSMITGKRGWQTVRPGDAVYAGSFCISGRGAYVAQKLGEDRLFVERMAGMPALAEELTPLERTIDRVLRILLVLVAIFAALLLATYFRLDLGVPTDVFTDAASVIFGIAPSGLFLMIIVTYTTGTADLAKLGALVHRARSVESLAEATVICFAEAGILTGTTVEIGPVQQQPATDGEPLPESRVRQILGDYARSTAASNLVTRALANSFEGSQRTVREEAPFLAALGWSAVTFDDRDLQGVYVLGEPEILEAHLLAEGQTAEATASRTPAATMRRLVSPLRRVLRRGDREPAAEESEPAEPEIQASEVGLAEGDMPLAGAESAAAAEDEDQEQQPFFRRWARRVGGTLRHLRRSPDPEEAPKSAADQETVYLFAYRPEPAPLRDGQGNVQLPEGLIPLCKLRYAQQLRPEAVELVREFVETGVSVKVFASGEPDQLLSLVKQAGLSEEGEARILQAGTVSGRDLEAVSLADWGRVAAQNAIFGHVTPAQVGALVRTLRESGESVAVVGDGVTDLPALQQANVAIARQTSTQAALGVADIVMMGSSPEALLKVLYKGQRIVHGLLDVLKLNLTQVFCLALLIAGVHLLSDGFPYVSAQGTAIAVITVAIPSVGLSLWARTGVVASALFGRTLARFVGPAAVTMSIAAMLVYHYFLSESGQIADAQMATTYTWIYAGLLLALFAKPPWPSRTTAGSPRGHSQRRWDWRMAALVLFLGVAASFLPAIPAAQQYLGLYWLQQPADYGIIGLAVLGWALILGIVWWLIPPEEYSSPPVNAGGMNWGA